MGHIDEALGEDDADLCGRGGGQELGEVGELGGFLGQVLG